jgi:hypothetical protein
VVAGARYAASGTRQWLLGSSWRELWTAPLTVPVLDLAGYAGGLTPTRTGGGKQTLSLRFRSGDGREFAFRSVDKDQTQTLRPDLQHTLVSHLIQDQISSLVPGAGLPAHALEEAAGVPHTREQLFRMPDDPRLGEYRSRFAGMLGTLEERSGPGARDIAGLAGADAVVDTDSMLAALLSGPGERFDDRTYLAVRLVDILLGDWDRHGGQYDWMRFPQAGGGHLWRVLPRDRDYAFVDYDGLLLAVARMAVKNAVRYRARIDLLPMLLNASQIDHRLLGGVDRAAWDSVTHALVQRLSDPALEAAVNALPPEYRALDGPRIAALLRARRDDLPRASALLYHVIAMEAEAHGTDRGDSALVERFPDGRVRVTLTSLESGQTEYQRDFGWVETREVRIYLHGGDDHAHVVGSGPEQVIVRLIGGSGDDLLADAGRSGRHTAFYDSVGNDQLVTRPRTRVDRRPWNEVRWEPGNGSLPPRDWGSSGSLLSPGGGWRTGGAGPYLAVGPSWKRYGFRRSPYAMKQQIQLLWLPEETRFGMEYTGDFRYVGSPGERTLLLARASGAEATRFYGFGNDTERGDFTSNHFRVFEQQLLGDAEHWRPLSKHDWLVLGVTGRATVPQTEAGTPAALVEPPGSDDFTIAGARAGLVLEHTDSVAAHRSGWTLTTSASGYPLAVGDASAFGGVRGVATTYLSAGSAGPTLALRAGGERLWGGFPLQYAAQIGGGSSLRGFASQRFSGDATAYGSAELRQHLTRARLLVHGDLGVFALADAGRVWYRGDSPGGWHSALGGGMFFTFLGSRGVSLSYAHGEQNVVHFAMHLPY